MSKRITAPGALALALLLSPSACAPIYLQGKYAYEEGWREGVVTDVGLGEEINVYANRDCRSELSPEQMRKTRFARVRFNSARDRHSQIVPLVEPAAVAVDDVVIVKTNDCSQALVAQSPR